MFIWRKIKTVLPLLRRTPKKYLFIIGVLLVMTLYLVAFRKQTLAYNYGGETCGRRLIVLPGIFSGVGSEKYEITTRGGWSITGKQITATSLCVSPIVAPDENSSETLAYAPWGGWLARFTYTIKAKQRPVVDAAVLQEPIPASRNLVVPLNMPDTTFSYKLTANNKQVACVSADMKLMCDVPGLGLEQGATYPIVLERLFKDEAIEEVANTGLETLSPLSVTESTIKNDATVYEKPKSVTLTTDKPVQRADLTVWRTDGDKPEKLEASTGVDGQTVTVTFAEDLPRQATIALKVATLEATDGSTPLDEQLLSFKTSGGPHVTGVNVGSSGVTIGTQIVVTFDQELSSEQDIGPLIAVSGGVSLAARQDRQLIFSTSGAERCAPIAITLKPDIKSPYDISGQSAWEYSGRMSCYTVSSIGTSVQGRSILAYHFGNSGPATVYTGAIHGNEVSTKYLMDRWIQELDANPGKIPSGKRVIVIPTLNPDGFAAGKRVNTRNVDLNRNFAVSDWKKDIEDLSGNPFPGGGGEQAMSEPETKAIAGFVAQLRPALVVSYHSTASLVISNQVGQSTAKASQYASLSGYNLSAGGGGEFGYQITGTADDYYGEKLGVASIVVELGSQSYHQFERNRTAMWAMLQ